MSKTPTFWGSDVIVSSDPFAFNPQVTALRDGSFIIAWEDPQDIHARHLDTLGSFTGGDLLAGVSAATNKELFSPHIVQQADGSVIVDYGMVYGPGDGDIRSHYFYDDFTPHAYSFGLEQAAADEFINDVTARSDTFGDYGSAVVYQWAGIGGPALVLRFLTSNGLHASQQIFVGYKPGESQFNASLLGLHSGFVAVTYETFNNTSGEREILLHTYAPNGTDVTGEVKVSGTGHGARFPEIVALKPAGTFVVAWQANEGIAFRSFSGSGTPIGDAHTVAGSRTGILPKIAALDDGGFIVGWIDTSGTEGDGSRLQQIALQRYDATGHAIGRQMKIDKPGDQVLSSLDTLADGRVVLTYESETGDSTGTFTLNYRMIDARGPVITGTYADDVIVGRETASTISGGAGNDRIISLAPGDALKGGSGDDWLIGKGGRDRLSGGNGDDVLVGGNDRDTLAGGKGHDTFVFAVSRHSRTNAPDTLKDFEKGDVIDLIGIGAGAGDPLTFIGRAAFHGQAGELHYVRKDGYLRVEADIDGDRRPDFAVKVAGLSKLVADDFLLEAPPGS